MRAIFQLAMKTSTCCCTPPILFNKKYLPRFLASPLSLCVYKYIYIQHIVVGSIIAGSSYIHIYIYRYVDTSSAANLTFWPSTCYSFRVPFDGLPYSTCILLNLCLYISAYIYIIYCMSHVYIPASSKVGWISAFCPINKFCRRTTFLGKPEFLLIYIAKPVFQRRKCLTKRRKYPTKPRKYPITWADNFSQRH